MTSKQSRVTMAAVITVIIGLTAVLANLAAIVPFLEARVSSLFPPAPTPNPATFAPAKPGESLLLVADFGNVGAGSKEALPEKLLLGQMRELIDKDKVPNMRAEPLRTVITATTSGAALGAYKAALII